MAIQVKHSKVSTIPDTDDTSLVRPSDWNADHTLTGTIDITNGGTGASTATDAINNLLPSQTGNNGKVLTTDGSNVNWSTNGVGDVIGPASATDNAIARFDTTTGKLIQNSGVTVGDTGAVTGITTLNASTSVSTPIVKATTSAGGALQNTGGTNQIQWGSGGGNNVSIDVSTNLNGTNAQIDISPTGTGHVHIKPSGSGSIEIAPTNAGTMNNMVIGGTTPLAGSFTTLNSTGGALNGTIGATTPAAGKFTTLEATGTSTLGTASSQYLQAAGGSTEAQLSAQGSGTNIPLVLQPKGTGAIQAQATTSTTAGGNARGANAVDWQTNRTTAASRVASGQYATLLGGSNSSSTGFASTVSGGESNQATNTYAFIGGGAANTASAHYSSIVGGYTNSATGRYNFIGNGYANSGTANAAVTTQATTTVTSGSTTVTLSGSNANIKVGQLITGTGIQSFPDTYVAAISGTSLTLSQNATATGTPTLSFFTPHGVVVGGGNNQATGSYSFIGGGGDAGTAANRNVASGDWSFVGGGWGNQATGIGAFVGGGGVNSSTIVNGNTASGISAVVGGGNINTASGQVSFVGSGAANTANAIGSSILGGYRGTTRGIQGISIFPASVAPLGAFNGVNQSGLLLLARETTDATPTVLASNASAAGTTNQVILPNNSAYLFKATVISGVTGGGNTSGWKLEGVIKRGANAASTAIVGSVTTTLLAQDAGASTWAVTATADTTNGGLKITFTGQAGTTIRTVCKVETTEMTF